MKGPSLLAVAVLASSLALHAQEAGSKLSAGGYASWLIREFPYEEGNPTSN